MPPESKGNGQCADSGDQEHQIDQFSPWALRANAGNSSNNAGKAQTFVFPHMKVISHD